MKINRFILTLGITLTISSIPLYAENNTNSQPPQTNSFEEMKRKAQQKFNRSQNDSIFQSKINKFSSQSNETYDEYRRRTKQEYKTYREETIKEYLQYRDSVLGDFVNAMSKPWKQAESKAAEECPKDESVEPERVSEEEFLQMMKNLYQEDSTDIKNKKDSINQVVNANVYNDTIATESLSEITSKVSKVSNKFLSFIKKLFKGKEQNTTTKEPKVQPKKVANLTTTKKQTKAESKTITKVQPKTTVKEVSKAKAEPKKEAKPIVKKQEVATTIKEEPKGTVKEIAQEPSKDTVKRDVPKSSFLSGGEPQQINVKEVVSLADLNIAPQPIPFVPVITHDDSTPQEFEFTFFGTPLKVRIDERSKFKLKSTTANNKVVTEAIKQIIKDKYLSTTLDDCLKIRDEYYLCDWAYLQMLDKLCTDFFGGKCNEATLLAGYLYSQSGYKMRFGCSADLSTLFILFACDQVVNGLGYHTTYEEHIKKYQTYYIFNYDKKESFYYCDYIFPKEKAMSLYIKETPAFDKDIKEYEHISKIHKVVINYSVNKNLIDFYNTYPIPSTNGDPYTIWSYYTLTPLSDEAKATIYPTIKKHTNGMKDVEAVNIILDLIQSYHYEYDDDVWGHNRAFFPDETLFYPACDCEDRAILFARVVNDLLGLETALIYYPNHLAAAVRFKEDVKGDYILKNGVKYTVCDPTIMWQPHAGIVMDQFRGRQATLLLLNNPK